MKKVAVAVMVFVLVLSMVGCGDSGTYKKAADALEAEDYTQVIQLLDSIPEYEDADNLREKAYAGEFRAIAEASTSPVCCEVASDGSYIKVDTNPQNKKDFIDLDYVQTVKDVNKALGFPESLWEKMGKTRAMDGRQEEESDTYKVSWSYHPDNGLEVIYERK